MRRCALIAAVLTALVAGLVCSVPSAHAATLTVTTSADEWQDNGVCSLREAIAAADTDSAVKGCPAGSGDDVITLAADTYALTIDPAGADDDSTGDLNFEGAHGSLTINGAGPNITVISGSSDRVFRIGNAGGAFILDGATVRNGHVPADVVPADGGGIYSAGGDITIRNSTIEANAAGDGHPGAIADAPTNGGSGGGIAVDFGTLTVIDSAVRGNTAGRGGGGGNGADGASGATGADGQAAGAGADGGSGGGIWARGLIAIRNSTIEDNRAGLGGWGGLGGKGGEGTLVGGNGGSGGNSGGGGDGGGLWLGVEVTVSGTFIGDNRAGDAPMATYGRAGGNATAAGGRAGVGGTGGAGGIGGDGGGAYFDTGESATANITVVNTTFAGNRAGVGGQGGDGGAGGSAPSGFAGRGADGGHGGQGGNGGGAATISSTMLNTTIGGNAVADLAVGGAGGKAGSGSVAATDGAAGTASIAGDGGGLYIWPASAVSAENMLIARNSPSNCSAQQPKDDGGNLNFPDATCGSGWSNGDPKLGIAQNNGGSTNTMALGPGSAAIDTGLDEKCPPTDQRGAVRPSGSHCDIGAYEAPKPDLLLGLAANPNPVPSGGQLTYSIAVKNIDPDGTAKNVRITDTLPTDVQVVSTSSSSFSCTTLLVGYTWNLTCSQASLAPLTTATVSVVVTVEAVAGSTLTNSAGVTMFDADPTPADDTKTVTTSVTTAAPAEKADLVTSIAATPNPVANGGTLSYTLVVRNIGPSAASNVVLSQGLSPQTTFASGAAGCSTPTVGFTGTVKCTFASIPSGGSQSITLTVKVSASNKTSVSSTASASSSAADPDSSNNSATAVTTVKGGSTSGRK